MTWPGSSEVPCSSQWYSNFLPLRWLTSEEPDLFSGILSTTAVFGFCHGNQDPQLSLDQEEGSEWKKLPHWECCITLQYSHAFCHVLTWISHGCTCVSHPKPPYHLPPHPIPLCCPSAQALSALFHAWNVDWRSISYMVIYMFQSYSVKSSHPHLLPESKRLFFMSVSFCCLAYIGSLLPSF